MNQIIFFGFFPPLVFHSAAAAKLLFLFFTPLSRRILAIKTKSLPYIISVFDTLLNPIWIWVFGFDRSKLGDCKKPKLWKLQFPIYITTKRFTAKSWKFRFVLSHCHSKRHCHSSVRICWHSAFVLSLLLIPFDMARVYTTHVYLCAMCSLFTRFCVRCFHAWYRSPNRNNGIQGICLDASMPRCLDQEYRRFKDVVTKTFAKIVSHTQTNGIW